MKRLLVFLNLNLARKLRCVRWILRGKTLHASPDVLSELTRQINSLNRQAKKAERFRRISDELRERGIGSRSYEVCPVEAGLR